MADAVAGGAAARAHSATLVVVGPADRLGEAAATIASLDGGGSLQGVLISTEPIERPAAANIAVAQVRAEHLNNAIAASRLSSLPTVIWWRGGPASQLDAVAPLADRVILDTEDPSALWTRARALVDRAAITDIRWAMLTRWRAEMAHFFDLPDVQAAAPTFSRLVVTGTDHALCTLFGGWLDASLGWEGRVAIAITHAAAAARISSVTLAGAGAELSMRLLPNGTCLATGVSIEGRRLASHVVSVGDESLAALLRQELRVRSRDIAFERALAAAAFLGV